MATIEKTIPSVSEIREKATTVRTLIASYTLCLDATIEDYPIGGSHRGKCRLQVERALGWGYRSVKTTTDRNGRWCAPKKSIYGNGCKVVITGLGGDRDTRWLTVAESGVYLSSANGENSTLIEAPHYTRPRRTETRFKITKTRVVDLASMEGHQVSEEYDVIEADPVELCDAYDAWMDEFGKLRLIVAETWKY